jgi:hypothetical protein
VVPSRLSAVHKKNDNGILCLRLGTNSNNLEGTNDFGFHLLSVSFTKILFPLSTCHEKFECVFELAEEPG